MYSFSLGRQRHSGAGGGVMVWNMPGMPLNATKLCTLKWSKWHILCCTYFAPIKISIFLLMRTYHSFCWRAVSSACCSYLLTSGSVSPARTRESLSYFQIFPGHEPMTLLDNLFQCLKTPDIPGGRPFPLHLKWIFLGQ